jgi:anti-sigma B factor antagonist
VFGVNEPERAGATQWHLAVGRLDGCPVLTVTGEIDIATAPELTRVLESVIRDAAPGSRVIVDLSSVAFFASAGVTAVVHATELAARSGSSLRLVVGSSRLVTRPLQICGADQVLSLYPTTDDAVR